MIEKLNKGKNK